MCAARLHFLECPAGLHEVVPHILLLFLVETAQRLLTDILDGFVHSFSSHRVHFNIRNLILMFEEKLSNNTCLFIGRSSLVLLDVHLLDKDMLRLLGFERIHVFLLLLLI